MCSCLLNNISACIEMWHKLALSDDKNVKLQAAGYIKIWVKEGQRYQLTAVMADILYHLVG